MQISIFGGILYANLIKFYVAYITFYLLFSFGAFLIEKSYWQIFVYKFCFGCLTIEPLTREKIAN